MSSFLDFEQVGEFLFKCKNCGEEIPSGIANVSSHWVKCGGKNFYNGLMNVANGKDGKINLEDVEILRKKFLK